MRDETKAAVDWWGEAIRQAKFDNGDPSLAGGMTTMLANMLSRQHPVTDEQVEAFKVALAPCIDKMLDGADPEDPSFGSYSRTLGVDYGPDRALATAAKECGIDYSRFPCKTVMWINPGHVSVSHGYGAPVEDVFGKDP